MFRRITSSASKINGKAFYATSKYEYSVQVIKAFKVTSPGFFSDDMMTNHIELGKLVDKKSKDGWDVDQMMPFSWDNRENHGGRTDLIWVLFSRPKN